MILGIDTATADTAVAIAGPEGCRIELLNGPGGDGRPTHAADVLPMVERALAAVGGWGEIDAIAVGVGPGSFTGVRIGVSTARALAQARELPLIGVPTTAALCAGIGDQHPEVADRTLIGIVDARRDELFAAVERGEGPEPAVLAAPDELARELGLAPSSASPRPLAAGDGAVRFRARIEAIGIEVLPDDDPAQRVSARLICTLGSDLEGGPPEAVTPDYLRRPDAERWLDGRRGN